MLVCILGLTACGKDSGPTEYEQYKMQNAQQLAVQEVDLFNQLANADASDFFEGYTAEEIAYICGANWGFESDGYAVIKAVDSFISARKSMGNITGIGNAQVKIDDKQIIVDVEVIGEKKNATAEVIMSNDMFYKLESAALNPISSMGELMGGAALNTVIGMGTVFAVLILISCIISCFRIIPALQKKAQQRKTAKTEVSSVTETEDAAEQISEVSESEDDTQLAAVIAAAVAAYEGSAGADGFVVRSIRRRR